MRLYKIELYKICSKKLFLLSALASLAILVLYFWSFVMDIDSTIDGVRYEGYQAVRMDRKITEEFRGVLTDQKITQIVEKYGFPNGVYEDYNRFFNRNYLNSFVMHNFSDGYFHDSDDYHVGTCTYPIAKTELGKASEATGKTLMLEYSYGWYVLTEVLKLGCILGMVLTLFAIAPVFSEESYMNTQQILFTTKEGKTKDITAKILAGMTVAIGMYAVIVILDFVLVWAIFGLDGWNNCFYFLIMEMRSLWAFNNYSNMSTWYMKDFMALALCACLIGILETAAITLYFSAHCSSPFQSVITSALCLVAPFCLNLVGRGSFNSILFIMSQLFDVFLLGVAVMCFVPDISYKAGSLAAKASCCILPMTAGLLFRRRFPFYYATPIMMIMPDAFIDIDRYPWFKTAALLFAMMVSVIFIVCSRKKYVEYPN